jgi:hypothetical protein
MGIFGRTNTSVAGALTGALATPFGTAPFMRADSISDSLRRFVPAGFAALEQQRSQFYDLLGAARRKLTMWDLTRTSWLGRLLSTMGSYIANSMNI